MEGRLETYTKVAASHSLARTEQLHSDCTWLNRFPSVATQEKESRDSDMIEWANQVSLGLGLDFKGGFTFPVYAFMRGTDIPQSFLSQVRTWERVCPPTRIRPLIRRWCTIGRS
jgi:hypothetical protein